MPSPGKTLWLPTAEPGDNLPYGVDISSVLAADNDTVASMTLALAPSGAGEMQIGAFLLIGGVVTFALSGGQPGRAYRGALTVTGAGPHVWEWIVHICVSIDGSVMNSPPPPSQDYGPVVSWNSGIGPYIVPASLAGPPATGLILTSPPLLIAAQTNVIASAPPGTSAILPTGVVGTIFVQDADQVNGAPIYPPVGAQINALGVNVPFVVGPGQRINFSTSSPSTQWWAA